MDKQPPIPKIPHAFFRWYCRNRMYEELHGDLEEFYYERVAERGVAQARLLYWWDVLRCCQPYAWKELNGQTNSNIGMIRNFYFTAIRNLLKHKSYFLINITGLAIGIASFTFIALYVFNELSYDRFHPNHEHIYRLSSEAMIRGEENIEATSSSPMAQTVRRDYPEVLQATRILKAGSMLIGKGSKKIKEDGVLYGDEHLLEVFNFPLTQGDARTALKHPRSIILSQTYARKYFDYQDPVGQQLTVEEDSIFYTVTGVFADIPANSHIQFDMMVSLSSHPAGKTERWVAGNYATHTYLVLEEHTNVAQLELKMKDIFYQYMAPEIEYYTGIQIGDWEAAGNSVWYKLRPITTIHLHSDAKGELEAGGNITYIYIYGLIAVIILFIAIFNFVNLATAHSATRAKEVGIRKVIGSTRRNLILQFLFESVLVSLLATVLGILLISAFKDSFIQLIGKEIAFDVTQSVTGWLVMLGFAFLVGVLAGSYPAFVLSAFRPSLVLKGTFSPTGKMSWLRNLLVTLQFSASIVIIIGTLMVYQQIDHMRSKNLGFDKDQVLVVERPDWLGNNMEPFRNEVLNIPNVTLVANSETVPGKSYDIRSYRRKDDTETFLFLNNQVTYDYQELMGLDLVAGRFFSEDYRADSNAVVLNEAAVKAFGFENPIGQTLTSAFKRGRPLTVIGVVKDYHYESLHKQVEPMSLELPEYQLEGFINLKISQTDDVRKTLMAIEDVWYEHTNDKPFRYFFFDEEFQRLYRSEATTGQLLLVFATLSVLIACLGLIGLIAYAATVRRKEMGIRKVLGAGTFNLIRLLSNDIVRLVIIATVVSWPLAYFATDYWLQSFAERITINPWLFVGATGALIAVVGLAIGFQTIRAATSNPVESLRDE